MAQAGTEPAAQRRESGPVAPYPVRPRRRWLLRRQGRRDGRQGRPDPLLLSGPVTTGMRRLLLRELAEATALVRSTFTGKAAGRIASLRDLGAEHPQRRAQLAAAERELAEIEERRPDPAAPPERRLGEQHRPEAVVRARRDRDHERRASGPRQRRGQARAALAEVERRHARLRAEVEELHRQAVDQCRRLRASFLREQAIYDQALVRRHPEGELVRDLLETAEPDLPEWTRQPPGLPELPGAEA